MKNNKEPSEQLWKWNLYYTLKADLEFFQIFLNPPSTFLVEPVASSNIYLEGVLDSGKSKPY